MNLTPVNECYEQAKAVLPGDVFDYVSGGAGDELTAIENERAFDKIFLKPRVLRDVSETDSSASSLGESVAFPLMIAPTAFHQLMHQGGEIETATAARECGVPMVASIMSCEPMEAIAKQSGHAQLWLQMYLFRDRGLTESLIRRAEVAGFRAIMLTVGVPYSGERRRDVTNQFKFPDSLQAGNLANSIGGLSVSEFVARNLDASLRWEDVEWLKSVTSLPVFLKGVLTPEDASLACESGVSGIVVSNHGGRQLDSTVSSLQALPDIVETIDGRIAVLFDSGVRRGGDIFKACALGADAVMIGRPVMWALACGGRQVVSSMLSSLKSELELTMSLTGCRNLDEVRQFRSNVVITT